MTGELLTLLKGLNLFLLVPALLGITVRIRRGQWRPEESLLAAIFIVFTVVTALQPLLFYGEFTVSRRYLLAGTPLLCGWGAAGIIELSGLVRRFRPSRRTTAAVLAALAVALLFDAWAPLLKERLPSSKSRQRRAILELSAAISRDWDGESAAVTPRVCDCYIGRRRPLVECELVETGYVAGGQSPDRADVLEILEPDYRITETAATPRPGYHPVADVEKYRIWRKQ